MYQSLPVVFGVPVKYVDDVINRKNIVIGVSLPTQKTEKWVMEKEYMEKYAQSKGVTLKIENAERDVDKQISQVENLISQGIDVLIIAPLDSKRDAILVDKAKKAGIKVMAYDRIIENSDLDLFLSFNNLRIGELQGRAIAEKVPRGNYIILSGDPRDANVKLITEGRMEYLKPLIDRRDIKIIKDEYLMFWNPKMAAEIVEEVLSKGNKVDAILAPNDNAAGEINKKLEAHGLAGKIPVTGMDGELTAIQRIVQGTQFMTVLKDIRNLARDAIDSAIKLANGKTIDLSGTVNNGLKDVPTLFVTPIEIDKSNVDSEIIDSGYYKSEDVYKR